MRHVFVSYSRKDSQTVDDIVARLSEDGMDVWIDREEIKGGELWRAAIVEAVDKAYAFVLMLSPNSVASDNVRKEVDLAEGANIELVPVLLAPAQLPAALRYQLAGIQWIEYYRDPEVKYGELVEVLQAQQRKPGNDQTPVTREVELVIKGLNLSQFGSEKQEQLLDLIADFTNAPRTGISLEKLTAGSVHAFIKMPSDAAYQIKTAALNRDSRLINFSIDALRLVGDRHFIVLKTGGTAPPKSGKSGGVRWLIGSLALVIAALFLAILIPDVLSQVGFFATATPTVTRIFTPAPTKTMTPTASSTPTLTRTAASTPSPGLTITATPLGPLTLTGLILANCRLGPSKAYEVYSNLDPGQTVTAIAINDEFTWFLVKNPEPGFHYPCWISSGKAIQVNGSPAGLPIISNWPPPGDIAPIDPRCSPWWFCLNLDPAIRTAIAQPEQPK